MIAPFRKRSRKRTIGFLHALNTSKKNYFCVSKDKKDIHFMCSIFYIRIQNKKYLKDGVFELLLMSIRENDWI